MKKCLLVTLVSLFVLTSGVVWLLTRSGAVELPGGLVVDISMMAHVLTGGQQEPMGGSVIEDRIRLPEGFFMEEWATGIPNARMLWVTEAGDLLASSPRSGKIYLVEKDADMDGLSDSVRVLLDGLDRPHGLHGWQGWLYIGEGDAVSRIRFDPMTRSVQGEPERIITGLPNGGNHWSKTIHVGSDEKLYVSIGSSCNVCEEDDPRRAALLRYDLDGSGEEIVATGLRNAVDFDWHPRTGELYATDNGRDLLGDDYPPCEINRIEEGGFYGWPYANPPRIPDPDFGDRAPKKVAISIPPAHDLPAHSAPLGIVFYEGDAFPDSYQGAAFVALHGSWNRSEKQGYEVVVVRFGEDGSSRSESFVTGFQVGDDVTGRPVALAVGQEGELFISDDYTGTIYKVTYGARPRVAGDGSGPASPKEHKEQPSPSEFSTEGSVLAFERGGELWRAHECVTCHPTSAPEGTSLRPLTALPSRYDLNSLQQFLRLPQPPMPVYSLSDDERRDLSLYLLERFR